MRFEGKTVIVTGGGSGIGQAAALRFAKEGAEVAIIDIRRKAIDETLALLGGGHHLGLEIDLLEIEQIDHAIETITEKFGDIDILVNNAGMGSFGEVTQIGFDHWREVMGLNVDALFWMSRQALPAIKKVGGSIVNVASVSGIAADFGFAAYNASKAAVINFTRAMAIDHAPGIRVNAVSPGLTATPLAVGLTQNPEVIRAYGPALVMGRPARPDEIAGAIAFLASSDASFINGHNLIVDGGMSAHTGQPHFPTVLAGQNHLDQADSAIRR